MRPSSRSLGAPMSEGTDLRFAQVIAALEREREVSVTARTGWCRGVATSVVPSALGSKRRTLTATRRDRPKGGPACRNASEPWDAEIRGVLPSRARWHRPGS